LEWFVTILRDGGIAAVIIFLGRMIIKQFFDRDIATFKADLARNVYEHQVSFGNVYAKRAEILSQLYSRLVEAERSFSRLTSWLESGGTGESFAEIKTRRFKESEEKYFAFREYFENNRLFLNDSIANAIDEIIRIFGEARAVTATYIQLADDRESRIQFGSQMHECFKKITDSSLPKVKKELEHQFREILGIKD